MASIVSANVANAITKLVAVEAIARLTADMVVGTVADASFKPEVCQPGDVAKDDEYAANRIRLCAPRRRMENRRPNEAARHWMGQARSPAPRLAARIRPGKVPMGGPQLMNKLTPGWLIFAATAALVWILLSLPN